MFFFPFWIMIPSYIEVVALRLPVWLVLVGHALSKDWFQELKAGFRRIPTYSIDMYICQYKHVIICV